MERIGRIGSTVEQANRRLWDKAAGRLGQGGERLWCSWLLVKTYSRQACDRATKNNERKSSKALGTLDPLQERETDTGTAANQTWTYEWQSNNTVALKTS
ncbi:UDPGT domain-containing protein [Psidium guajava]|nr:UDPGT domain-containing protein [Psidium guajava]